MTDTNELLALLLRETVHQFQDARAQLHADDQRAWEALGKPEGTHDTTNVQRLCAEVERLRGIIDDIEVESGYCHFLDDEEHEPPHLPDHVRGIVKERDAARAEVERLRDDAAKWHNLLPVYEDAEREVQQLRADMRDALELLQNPEIGHQEWLSRSKRLAEKHKETP